MAGDLDMNAALMDDVRSELHKSSHGPGDPQIKKITSMQSTLRIQQDNLKDAELRAQEVRLISQRSSTFSEIFSNVYFEVQP